MSCPHKQETDMTERNNEPFEMTSEELEQVSGGAVHIPMGTPKPPMS
jgi:hypothetical protein